MPKRVQVQEPLSNTPSLSPVSRPIGVGAGARPAARLQDSGIYQLADALGEWQPVLRQMIADKRAEEQKSALTQGELKAAELSAQERMSALNGKLKQFVDDGTVSKAQLPFFQTGFARRTGRDLALTELQPALDEAYKSTTTVNGRVDPEQVINDTLKSFRDRLPQGDIYAAEGFDEVAGQIAQNFRQRSNSDYRKNYEVAAETKIANEGIDLLQQHVLSDDIDGKPKTLDAFRAYFTNLKETELPKAETAPFVVKNVVSPMVEDLVARGDFDGAEELVETMEQFDVTGQGGLLGNMSATKGALAQMKLQIAERRRGADEYNDFAKKDRMETLTGSRDAKALLVELGDAPLSAVVKRQKLAEYREANKDKPSAVAAFADYLDEAYRKGVPEDDAETVVNISRLSESTDPTVLDSALAAIETADSARTLSPATKLKLEDRINKSRALVGLIAEEDVRLAERTIYRTEIDDYTGKIIPAFSSGSLYSQDPENPNGGGLTGEQRLAHRQSTMQFYRDTLATKLRAGAFPNLEAAQAALPQLRAQSLTEAIDFADKLTASFLPKPTEAQPGAAPTKPGQKPQKAEGGKPNTPDPLQGVVSATPTPDKATNDRRRAAFLSFFSEPTTGGKWNVSDAALSGQIPILTSDPGDGPLTPLRRTTTAEDKANMEAIKPVLIYKAVKTDYLGLRKYRERGSDLGDPNYIKRLREFATNLKTYGGAEYLSPEQMTDLGLNPAAFPTVGTKAELIK